MTEELVCPQCGKRVERGRWWQKFCSTPCRRKFDTRNATETRLLRAEVNKQAAVIKDQEAELKALRKQRDGWEE